MHLIIHTVLAILIIKISDWCKINEFGLVYWFNTNVAVTVVIPFFVLDFFGVWLVQFTEYQIPVLWHFQVVHHADNIIDVTTGLRHHPIESLLRSLFFFMGIAISGAPM